ncbi:ATP cone domain-containing protein [Balneolaceae bacterium ANBcel3]|nr:ATP cone domain-containing protein [Balneolaceae bacterium ANBcel3]
MSTSLIIRKASGEVVRFSEEKLRDSLERSGATESQMDGVVNEVHKELYDGITTQKIYRKAYDLLRKKSRSKAARYKLKKAIMELGPTGYPFELFVASILEEQGFETRVGMIVEGRCVTHEIDVLARKNGKLIMVECKFHNRPGVKCDVKIPLYIHSRFRDLVTKNRDEMKAQANGNAENAGPDSDDLNRTFFYGPPDDPVNEYQGWIVTNTRFTNDAISYGTCSGLVMLGWDHPAKGSLRERIGLSGLHPVTCLSTLQRKEKAYLLENGVVLCKRVPEHSHLLSELGLSEQRIKKIIRECEELVYELDVPED